MLLTSRPKTETDLKALITWDHRDENTKWALLTGTGAKDIIDKTFKSLGYPSCDVQIKNSGGKDTYGYYQKNEGPYGKITLFRDTNGNCITTLMHEMGHHLAEIEAVHSIREATRNITGMNEIRIAAHAAYTSAREDNHNHGPGFANAYLRVAQATYDMVHHDDRHVDSNKDNVAAAKFEDTKKYGKYNGR